MEIKDIEKKLEKSASEIKTSSFDDRWNAIKDEIETPKTIKWKRFKRWIPGAIAACLVVISCSIAIPIALGSGFAKGGSNAFEPAPGEDYMGGVSDNLSAEEGDSSSGILPEGGSGDSSVSDGDYQAPETGAPSEGGGYYLSTLLTPTDFGSDIAGLNQRLTAVSFGEVDEFSWQVQSATLFYLPDEQTIKGYQIVYEDNESASFGLKLNVYDSSVMVENWKPSLGVQVYSYKANTTQVEYWCIKQEMGVYTYRIQAKYKNLDYYLEYACENEDITPFLKEFFK